MQDLASSGFLDPASSLLLSASAQETLVVDPDDDVRRYLVESELTRTLGAVLDTREDVDEIRDEAEPDGALADQLLAELDRLLDDRLIGFAVVHEGDLDHLYLAPALRRRGHGTALLEHVADRVGKLRRLGERADEEYVNVERQFRLQVLEPGVAHQVYVMARLFTPDRDDLRHDAGKVRVHDTGVHGGGRGTSNQIENADAERTHSCLA
mgnify:CR=1 FL=1